MDNVVEVENEDHTVDSAADGSATSGGVCFDIHHFDKGHPDYVGVTKEKLDSFKGEIDKYTKYFKKNRLIYLTKMSTAHVTAFSNLSLMFTKIMNMMTL